MNKLSLAVCLSIALTGCTTTAPRVSVMNASPADARSTGPVAGTPIQTMPVPEIQEKHRDRPGMLLSYRPSQNLPTILEKDVLLNKKAFKDYPVDVKIGTLPRLAVIPCDNDCVGNPDYEAAEKALLADYNKAVTARRGGFSYQGVLPIKVAAFNQRGYFQRTLPVVNGVGVGDIFAISLAIEGKKLTLSWENHMDERTTTKELASTAAGVLIMALTDAARGEKPQQLHAALPEKDRPARSAAGCQFSKTVNTLHNALGKGSVPSKLEPLGPNDKDLLPAFDGIEPNEVNPITQPIVLHLAGC